ncbi:NAD(P)H-dependent oxidoreductase, partial [Klebsiella pneumoniae]
MKVLLIYAHPEPRSLNGALKNFAVRHLQQAGHEVQVSDLYAMRWKAGYDADDSGAPPVGEFWRPTLDLMPGSSLLSHGETPHYHRRYGVSLL